MNKKEKQILIGALQDIIYMARRYADGRMTFAPQSFNDAYDKIRGILGDDIEQVKGAPGRALKDEMVQTYPYAQDGSYNATSGCFDAIGTGRRYLSTKKETK